MENKDLNRGGFSSIGTSNAARLGFEEPFTVVAHQKSLRTVFTTLRDYQIDARRCDTCRSYA